MSIPSSAMQLLVLLVLVVPGFVYQVVRIQLSGRKPSDSELSARILNAIVASTIFALAYATILGRRIAEPHKLSDSVMHHPRCAAVLGFAAAFAIPAALAACMVWLRNSDWWSEVVEKVRPSSWARLDPRPSAWDVAFAGPLSPCFVRVQLRDGTWFAGWYGTQSYASSWPDPRTLFLEISYEVDETGKIGEPVEGSAGAIIDCGDAVLIELLQAVSGDSAAESGTMEEEKEDSDGY